MVNYCCCYGCKEDFVKEGATMFHSYQTPEMEPNPGMAQNMSNLNRPGLQELLKVLRSVPPNTQDKKLQIVQILRCNPQLMAAFIKQRMKYQAMQQQQQQQQQNVSVQQQAQTLQHMNQQPPLALSPTDYLALQEQLSNLQL